MIKSNECVKEEASAGIKETKETGAADSGKMKWKYYSKRSLMRNFFQKESQTKKYKSESLESNTGTTNWWLGFKHFPLFEHSVSKKETATGQNKLTKETPWLVWIMSIIWLVCSLTGLVSTKESHKNKRKTETQNDKEAFAEAKYEDEIGLTETHKTKATKEENLGGRPRVRRNTGRQRNWTEGAE